MDANSAVQGLLHEQESRDRASPHLGAGLEMRRQNLQNFVLESSLPGIPPPLVPPLQTRMSMPALHPPQGVGMSPLEAIRMQLSGMGQHQEVADNTKKFTVSAQGQMGADLAVSLNALTLCRFQ